MQFALISKRKLEETSSTAKDNYSDVAYGVCSLLLWFVHDEVEDILEHLDAVQVSEKTRKFFSFF